MTGDDEDFESGFKESKAPKEKPPEDSAPSKGADDEGQEDEKHPAADPPPEPSSSGQPPAPKRMRYVRITDEEAVKFRSYEARATKQDEQLSKAFGTIGKLQQQLNDFVRKANGSSSVAEHDPESTDRKPSPPPSD